MEIVESKSVQAKIENYPLEPQNKLKILRQLIFDTANEMEIIPKLIETTKWGEPSYLTKSGSTIRMDWKKNTPDKYYLYFICTTELVSTFRIIFGEELTFEGNRAIVFDLSAAIPHNAVKSCLKLALNYKKVKHLPLLGA